MKAINKRSLRGVTLTSLLLGVLWLSGCQFSDDFECPVPPGDGSDVELTFRVSDASNPGTYADGVFDDEDFDKELLALIFVVDEEANGDTELRYQRYRAVKTKTKEDGTKIRSILLPATLVDVPFTLVLCANTKAFLDEDGNLDLKMVEQVPPGRDKPRGRTYTEFEKITQFTPHEEKTALPMWGEIFLENGIKNQAEQTLGEVVLLRSLCRVDVGLNYSKDEVDGKYKFAGLHNFLLKKVHISRSKSLASLVPNKLNYTYVDKKYNVTAPTVPGDANTVDWIEFTPNEDVKKDKACQEMIYLPEQENREADKERPCVILEGIYTFPNGDEVTGFYRVDYVETAEGTAPKYVDLLRSHLIRFNITAVKGPGCKTKEEARDSKPFNIEVTLADYTVFNSNTIFDGQYHFTLDKKEVTMPRETDIQYTLPVGANILLKDWKMRLQSQTDVTEGSDATTIENGHFRVTKAVVGDETEGNNNYTLTICTIAPWDATTAAKNEDVLYIDAKRLKIQIPLHQIDQSAADWQAGNVTDNELGGSLLSKSAFYFGGGKKKEDLQIYIGNGTTAYDISYKNDAGQDVTTLNWLTVTQNTTKLLPTFEFSVPVNASEKVNKTIVTLTEQGNPDAISFSIPVTQAMLVRDNLLDKPHAVLWRDRNVGAIGNSPLDGAFSLFTKNQLVDKGNTVCPSGWVLPSISDFNNMLGNKSGITGHGLELSNGNYYIVLEDGTNKIFMQPRDGSVAIDDMYYWTSDDKFVHFERYRVGQGDPNKLKDKVVEGADDVNGQVRCVRKFSIEKDYVTLDMSGKAQYINFWTVQNNDPIHVTYPAGGSNGFSVRAEGTRLVVERKTANITPSPVSMTVTLHAGADTDITKTLTITQEKKLELVDAVHPYITIGNIEWYGKNVGADNFENGYLLYKDVTSPNERILKDETRTLAQLNAETNITTINPGAFGTPHLHDAAKTKCAEIADGGGWRLPTPFEWRTLLSRTRIVEGSLSEKGLTSDVLYNTEKYPMYVVNDGERMMYLPLGKVITAGNPETNFTVRSVGYHTSAGVGTAYTHVMLSRYLNADKGGQPDPLLWPWGNDYIANLIDDGMVYGINYVAISESVRCVREKK